MKNILMLVLCIGLSSNLFAQNQSIEAFFEKYINHKQATQITIEGWLLKIATEQSTNDEAEILKNISKIRVLFMDEGNIVSKSDYKGLISDVRAEKFEELMTVRDDDAKIDFFVREDGNKVTNLLILVYEDNEFVLVSLEGSINWSDLEKIDIESKGLEELKKVRKKKSPGKA